MNDNGLVSLAEVTRGVRDVLALEEVFHCRPAVNAAFHHCRDIHKVELPHLADMNWFSLEADFEKLSCLLNPQVVSRYQKGSNTYIP